MLSLVQENIKSEISGSSMHSYEWNLNIIKSKFETCIFGV